MKRGSVYTVVFMFVVSAVFTALLAVANSLYLPSIRQNEELAHKKSILYSFGSKADAGAGADAIEASYARQVEKKKVGSLEVYVRFDENKKPEGYAIPFSGPGLWGTIRGYLAVSGDLNRILGVDFTSHSETPGLGGRIDEEWFKEQFRGLEIKPDGDIEYRSEASGQVDAITGATSTSKAVLTLLNEALDTKLAELEVAK